MSIETESVRRELLDRIVRIESKVRTLEEARVRDATVMEAVRSQRIASVLAASRALYKHGRSADVAWNDFLEAMDAYRVAQP